MHQRAPDINMLWKQLDDGNRRSQFFITVAAMAAVVLLFTIEWSDLAKNGWYALVVVGLANADTFN